MNKFVDVPVLQIQERIVEILKIIPQDRVQQRTEVQTVDVPQRAHREHAPNDVVRKVPVRICRECHQKTSEHQFVDRQ